MKNIFYAKETTMRKLAIALLTVFYVSAAASAQQNEKDAKQLEKRIKQAVNWGVAVLNIERHAGRDLQIQRMYLPNKDKNTVCAVFRDDNNGEKISGFMRGSNDILSTASAGAEILINSSCTKNGQLVPGTDITKEVIRQLTVVPGLKDLQ
jgi:hypothetical protein